MKQIFGLIVLFLFLLDPFLEVRGQVIGPVGPQSGGGGGSSSPKEAPVNLPYKPKGESQEAPKNPPVKKKHQANTSSEAETTESWATKTPEKTPEIKQEFHIPYIPSKVPDSMGPPDVPW